MGMAMKQTLTEPQHTVSTPSSEKNIMKLPCDTSKNTMKRAQNPMMTPMRLALSMAEIPRERTGTRGGIGRIGRRVQGVWPSGLTA
jgi:hypothetical protein